LGHLIKGSLRHDCFVFSIFKIILFFISFYPSVPNMVGHNLNFIGPVYFCEAKKCFCFKELSPSSLSALLFYIVYYLFFKKFKKSLPPR
jgi:hypothetical protein